MKNKKLGLALAALVAPLLGASALTGSAFAADPTTYTVANFGNDEEFFSCIKVAVEAESTDEEVSIEDIKKLTSLTCTEIYDIQKIAGINLFTSLTSLTLSGQANLTSIAPVSSSLKELYVYNSGLTSADLSKTTALTKISLANNALTTIDLSANTKLQYAWLYGNAIESLDISKIPSSLSGLYLDDDVLIKTKFTAMRLSEEGDYYASETTNDKTNFNQLIIMSGVYQGKSEITTTGVKYYNKVINPGKCISGDDFCIIFDSDIENYKDYIQLAATTDATTSDALIAAGQDSSKLNYQIQIDLADYDPNILVPDTGIFTGQMDGTKAIIYAGAAILGAGALYLVAYMAKRGIHRNRFHK